MKVKANKKTNKQTKKKKKERKFMKQKPVPENINKINKPPARLTKKGKEDTNYQYQE